MGQGCFILKKWGCLWGHLDKRPSWRLWKVLLSYWWYVRRWMERSL